MGSFFPFGYDLLMKPLEMGRFKQIRKQLLNKATGRVLEIGSGTGVNFPLYEQAVMVDAIEPNLEMRTKSLKRLKQAKVPIQTYLVKAEKLPFPDNTFDTVVCTLVLCTIPDPLAALQEIQRVSKTNSTLLLFEHVRLNHSGLAKTQDLLTPFWKRVCDGCHLNRDPLGMLKQTSFTVEQVASTYKGLFLTIECTNRKQTYKNV